MADAIDLARWDDLPYPARVRRAVLAGRAAATDPAAAATLAAWRGGPFPARLLAVAACHGSRDSAALLELCSDPSRIVARTAFKAIGLIGDDDSLLAALRTVPPKKLPAALGRLRRRTPVIDRFLDERVAAGDDAAVLLPFGSAALVERHFALGEERGGASFWRRLTANHTARAAAAIIAKLDALTAPDGLLFGYARDAIARLGHRHPDTALAVVAALRRHQALGSIPLQPIVARRPVEVAEMVLAAPEPASVNFERVAGKLGVPRAVAVFRRAAHWLGSPTEWLKRFPAADRAAIYGELSAAWTLTTGLVSAGIIRLLPADLREAEARRVVALPALAARPVERMPFAALLPWDEAREHGRAWLGHPDAEYRAAVLVALCEAARFDRTRLAELLTVLGARKHEQDPVRLAFLTAVAALPPGRWAADHLPGLAKLVRDALDAGDLSSGTVAAVGSLLNRVLPHHPTWAVEQLAVVSRERGSVPAFTQPLTAGQVRQLAPVLTPVMLAWSKRERESSLLALARSVGKHLPEWPELTAELEGMVQHSAERYSADAAMNLLLEYLPKERERIVTATLARDESWILEPKVLAFVNRRRQDLLTPFLGHRTYAGRFSTGRVRHVLPLMSGFHRWTTSQQEAFAATLAEVAATPKTKADEQATGDVQSAVRRLAQLPAIEPTFLIKLAGDERQAVRETAVRALGRLDARQGIPELLEALGDDRARFAVYALRAALCDLAPARVLAVMRGVPLGKVTVAKEAVRLAGEFGGTASLAWFTELDATPLHRDVRGALLRALWDHLERPEAWAIMDASAGSPDTNVVIGLARIQVDRASPAARDRVNAMLLRLLAHPEPTVRLAVLARFATTPVPDPKRELLAATLAKLASPLPDERAFALSAAVGSATDADAPAFAAAFTGLLPERKELAEAVEQFALRARGIRDRLLPVRSAVLAAVEADPSATWFAVKLAAARHPAKSFAAWVVRLAATDRWHTATHNAVWNAVSEIGWPAADLERAEAAWAAAADPSLRWLALRVLQMTAAQHGWTPPRRERLAAYQQDAHPLVADDAAFVFPPERGGSS